MKPIARETVNAGLILLGVLSAGMGLKGFLLPSSFIDGGVTGVSMLLSKTTGLQLAVLLPSVNLPFIIIGYRQIGGAFAMRSLLAITGLAAALAVVPYPEMTHDLVLTAVFGGILLGAGIGLAIRGGAVLDGTEIAALVISKRVAVLGVGDVILSFNVVLFLVAMTVLGIEQALYSILTYVAAARTLEFVLYGLDAYMAMTIMSGKNAEIRERITRDLGRGVTIYRGYGGMSGVEQNIIYCVVTRLEVGKVKAIVRELDEAAFVVFHPLAGADGGVVKSRGFH